MISDTDEKILEARLRVAMNEVRSEIRLEVAKAKADIYTFLMKVVFALIALMLLLIAAFKTVP
jgi:hypothetical protein